MLHCVLVSILYKIGSPLEVSVIDQTELSFFISFILRGSWMIIVSTKNSRSEDSSQSVSTCSTSCTFFQFRGQQTLKWFFRLQFKHDFPYAGHFPLGWEPLRNLHFLIISFDFSLGTWWRGLRSLLILWRLAADLNRRISRACFRVSSAACPGGKF